MKGCKGLVLGLIIFLTGLGGMHGLSAADPRASLSASDSTPDPGDTITLTGSYSDSDGNLSAATIRDLGSGNHSGDLGSFSAIGSAGESISGSSDSITRSFTFPSTTASGTYTFRTEVVDTTSGSDVAWKTVTVQSVSSNTNPTVSISATSTSITAGGSVTVTATASDSDGTIQSVKFRRNGSTVRTDTSSPYTYTYSSASVGTHSFQATATDNDGATATSNTVTVTVSAPTNAAPSASLSVNDSTPNQGQRITITGTYTDSNGNLSSATIRNLGSGNKTGNTGSFPSIGTAGESISGSRDSISRNFNIPSSASTGAYTFRTEVVDTNSASDIAWKTVTVNVNPTVSISASSTSITTGGSVTVTATASDSDGSIQSVRFRRNGSTVKTDTSSPYSYIYSSASTGTHRFQVTATDNDGGTKTSNTVTVTVVTPNVNPTVSISASSTSITTGGSVTVTATASDSDGTIQSVKFRRNGTTVKTDTSSPYNYIYSSASTGTHRFQATATDNDGGTKISNTVTVTVVTPNANPSASLSVSDSTPNQGQRITITGNYTDSNGNLSSATIRNLGSGNKVGNTGSFPSIGTAGESISGSRDSISRNFSIPSSANTGAYTFRTEVVDTNSASDIAWKTVTVNVNPTVSLTVSDTEITEGEMVTLTATADDSDGSVTRVSFIRGKVFQSYDDPASSTVTHTYTPVGTGERTFYAQAFDNDGAVTSSNNVTFNVIAAPTPNVPPTVSISASSTAINEGESVTVTADAADSDGTIQSVEFRRNGNMVSTDTSDPYAYTYSSASAGTHIFEATATDNEGDDTISNTVTVEVNAKPTVSLTVSPAEITLGQMVTLTAIADDSDGSVTRVSFIRGKVFQSYDDPASSTVTHTYTPVGTGERTFYAQAFDNDGAVTNSNNVTFDVVEAPVNVHPTVSISAPHTAINEGESVTVTAIATDADGTIQSVEFRRNGITVSTDTSSPYIHTYRSASAGTHIFEATAVDDDGDETISNTVTVEVNAKPTVSLTVSPAEITLGEMVTLTATATDSDGTVVRVSFIRGKVFQSYNNPTTDLVTHTYPPAETGEFTFYAQAFDNDGAVTSSNNVTFTVIAAPPPPPANVAPEAMLSVSESESNPKRGETITITGTYTDDDENLATAAIYDLGTGDKTDNTGTFPIIAPPPPGTPVTSITGGSASITRDFTIPVTTALGLYTFRTDVVDAASASDAAWETVTVTNNNPTVSISASDTAINEGESVTVTATPSDSDGTIQSVDFIRNATTEETDTSAPYAYTYSSASAGTHLLKATTVDNDGGTGTSNVVTLTVNPATPVKVSLSRSASRIELNNPVTLQAEVSGPTAVSSVKFYRNGSLIYTDTASPYSITNTPEAIGTYSYYVRAEFSDQSYSDSMTKDVEVVNDLNWDDIDNNGILDQVLATLDKPPLMGVTGTILQAGSNSLKGVELIIDEVPFDVYDLGNGMRIQVITFATVAFGIEEGYTYQVQYQNFLDNIDPLIPVNPHEWVNWGPTLPEPGSSKSTTRWCDYENIWRTWSSIPVRFRVVKIAKDSYAKGAPYSVDVNGDGVVDRVQEVSPEVLNTGDGEFIIKADCPEGVIGCDEANTEFVINDNGQWIIVDENPSIARETSPDDPHYPDEVGTGDRVITVPRSTLLGLSFFFAEVTPPVELKDINAHDITSDDVIITPWDTTQNITDNNIAWIDAHTSDEDSAQDSAPRMPQLEFRIPGLEGVTKLAKLEVQYNRGNGTRPAVDRVSIPSSGAYTEVTGDTWKIWKEYQTDFFGGDATLTFKLTKGSNEVLPPQTINFRIGGKNPDDARCKTYIESRPDAGPMGSLWFANAIAKHETKAQNRDNLYYNQFNELLPHIGRPVFGDDRNRDGTPLGPGGYGIYQVTVTNIPREQIWNWQKNVDAGLTILRNKQVIAWEWMNEEENRPGTNLPHGQRPQARLDSGHNVPVPDHTVEGVLFSDDVNSDRNGVIEDAVTIKAYNSAGTHYCFWSRINAGWMFNNTNTGGVDYVARVCREVENVNE